ETKAEERKSNAGRKPYDTILKFKILVLQSLHNLSDEQTEYLIRDRLSFMRFLAESSGPEGPGASRRSPRDWHSPLGPPRALRVASPRERSLLGCASLSGDRRPFENPRVVSHLDNSIFFRLFHRANARRSGFFHPLGAR